MQRPRDGVSSAGSIHRLEAFRANLFEVSVWESSGEKQLIQTVCVKPDVRVAIILHKESAERERSALK